MFNVHSQTIDLGDGRSIKLETGKLARQAHGAVLVTSGNCALLATTVAAREPRPGQGFFPLTVDYQEKFAAAGRIPGSFFKREGRLNDYEILISRLIDRALRPLFPKDYLCEVQVMVQLQSSDEEVTPDSLAGLAASAALAVSDIPITEITSAVRVAKVDGAFVINPTRSQIAEASLEFIIAGTADNIMMVEGESSECSEEELIEAIETKDDIKFITYPNQKQFFIPGFDYRSLKLLLKKEKESSKSSIKRSALFVILWAGFMLLISQREMNSFFSDPMSNLYFLILGILPLLRGIYELISHLAINETNYHQEFSEIKFRFWLGQKKTVSIFIKIWCCPFCF